MNKLKISIVILSGLFILFSLENIGFWNALFALSGLALGRWGYLFSK